MINHINKNIDFKALEDRLEEEIEEKLVFSCYAVDSCFCNSDHSDSCWGNISIG